MRPPLRHFALGALALVLVGCSLLPGGVNAALDGEWRLQSGTNQGQPIPIVPPGRITLRIDGTTVGGTAACNIYGGTLKVKGTTIAITALSMTEMACQEDVMASEAAYLAALPQVTSVERDGSTLVLMGPQVELRFALVPAVADTDLVGPVWVLDSLILGEAVSSITGDEATLQLKADSTVSASTGCRTISGHYTLSGSQVQVTLVPYDLIGCGGGLGGQDEHVLAVIGPGFSFSIEGDRLTLTSGGKGLGYQAPTTP